MKNIKPIKVSYNNGFGKMNAIPVGNTRLIIKRNAYIRAWQKLSSGSAEVVFDTDKEVIDMAGRTYMTKKKMSEKLKHGAKAWCWWLSRYLWYEGTTNDNGYKFVDICDVQFVMDINQLTELEFNY